MSFWNKTKDALLGLQCGRGDHRSHTVADFEGIPTCKECSDAILWVRAQEEAMAKNSVYDCHYCLDELSLTNWSTYNRGITSKRYLHGLSRDYA